MVKRRDRINPSSLRRLFGRMSWHFRKRRRALILATGAMIGASAMEIARPWPLKIIFDGGATREGTTSANLTGIALA